jgi:hypothetical protein
MCYEIRRGWTTDIARQTMVSQPNWSDKGIREAGNKRDGGREEWRQRFGGGALESAGGDGVGAREIESDMRGKAKKEVAAEVLLGPLTGGEWRCNL